MAIKLAVWKERNRTHYDQLMANPNYSGVSWKAPCSVLTFALKALPEQSSEEPLAELAHGRSCVRVDSECVGDLHLAHQDFVQMNRSTRVEAPCLTGGPWLAEYIGNKAHRLNLQSAGIQISGTVNIYNWNFCSNKMHYLVRHSFLNFISLNLQ